MRNGRKELILISGISHWRCSRCKNLFSADGYYKHTSSTNGLTTECRKCHGATSYRTRDKVNTRRITREAQRRARSADPEKFRKRQREAYSKTPRGKKHKARARLRKAVESGRIIRPEKCGECGEGGRIDAHHRDYDLPYEVEWLCRLCHGRRHWKENSAVIVGLDS